MSNLVHFIYRFNLRQALFTIYFIAVACKLFILLDLLLLHPAPLSAILVTRVIVYLFSSAAEIVLLFFTVKKVYKDYKDLWLTACICLQLIYIVIMGLFCYVSNDTFIAFFFVPRKYIPLFFVVNIMLCFLAWMAIKAENFQKQRSFSELKSWLDKAQTSS